MKGMLLSKGKYRATGDYAHWLGESLALTVRQPEEVSAAELRASDYVVMGSAVYFGKLLIRNWLQQHLMELKDKKLFLFVVCGTAPSETETLNGYLQASIPEEIRNRCEVFFLPGRMIRKQLGWWDRLAIRIADRLSKNKPEKDRIPADYDRVDRSALRPLLSALNRYANAGELALANIHD